MLCAACLIIRDEKARACGRLRRGTACRGRPRRSSPATPYAIACRRAHALLLNTPALEAGGGPGRAGRGHPRKPPPTKTPYPALCLEKKKTFTLFGRPDHP